MRQKILCAVVWLSAVIVILINVAFTVRDAFFYSLDNLPTGTHIRDDYLQEILFSEGHLLKVYQVNATKHSPSAVRVEYYNDKTEERKTIYWQIGTEETMIYWHEDNTSMVTINGVPINFETEVYDCRDYKDFIYKEKIIEN